MLVYPHINPVMFSLGPVTIHWYGVMYLLGFGGAWWLARYRIKDQQLDWTPEALADLVFYVAMGVVIGGRCGYMLFYDSHTLWQHPWQLFALWQGGMSFHGGLLGVIAATLLYARKTGRSFLTVTDFIAPLAPVGLATGRLGNFINGELWGRPTTMPWGMVFRHIDDVPRHPSQLYEFGLEGVLLFLLMWFLTKRQLSQGLASGYFLVGYAILRSFAECFREPDTHIGFLFAHITMGQVLCLPMLLVGLGLIFWAQGREVEVSSSRSCVR